MDGLVEPLRKGYSIRAPVITGCMTPLIPVNAWVRVDPVAPEKVAVGDVVVYARSNGVFAHRVLARLQGSQGASFLCKGDGMRYFIIPKLRHRETYFL